MQGANDWYVEALSVLQAAARVLLYCEEVAEEAESEGSRRGLARLLLGDDHISHSEWREHKATLESGLEVSHEAIEGLAESFNDMVDEYLQAFGLADDVLARRLDDEVELCAECGLPLCGCDS